MGKSELLVWIAGLADGSPELEKIAALAGGGAGGEKLLTLKALAAEFGCHYTHLHRLNVQRVGERMGFGRRRYRRSVVENYLRSPDCATIREGLRAARRAGPDGPGGRRRAA